MYELNWSIISNENSFEPTSKIINFNEYTHLKQNGIDIFFKLEDEFHTEEFAYLLSKDIKNFRDLIDYKNNNPEKFYNVC